MQEYDCIIKNKRGTKFVRYYGVSLCLLNISPLRKTTQRNNYNNVLLLNNLITNLDTFMAMFVVFLFVKSHFGSGQSIRRSQIIIRYWHWSWYLWSWVFNFQPVQGSWNKSLPWNKHTIFSLSYTSYNIAIRKPTEMSNF